MSFYSELAESAKSILAEFGGTVILKSASSGQYDPATGSASVTTSETTRKGVFLSFGSGQTYVRGQMIQTYDKRLLLDASAGVGSQDTFIDSDGSEWSPVSINSISPAGVAVVYDMHVRK